MDGANGRLTALEFFDFSDIIRFDLSFVYRDAHRVFARLDKHMMRAGNPCEGISLMVKHLSDLAESLFARHDISIAQAIRNAREISTGGRKKISHST